MKINNLCLECMKAEYAPTGICPVCGSRQGFVNQDHQLMPSSILNGKYLVGRAIGQGGFGITYVGFDIQHHMKVAIKEFFPSKFATRCRDNHTVTPYTGKETEKFYKEECDKFYKEAQKLQEFRNVPNVVSVLDYFSENNTAYIVMEFIEGLTLKEYLSNLNMKMQFGDITSLLEPIMKALIEIHKRNVIHRDVSPDNILLSGERIILVDFGSARVIVPGKNLTVNIKGGYTPQEQYDEQGSQGPWTDVYALGATIYRAVTGVVPFNSQGRSSTNDLLQPPRMLNPEITPEEEAVLLKALAIQPKDRYRKVEEFLDALNKLSTSPNPKTEPNPTIPGPTPKPDDTNVTVTGGTDINPPAPAKRPSRVIVVGILMILSSLWHLIFIGNAYNSARVTEYDVGLTCLFCALYIGLTGRVMINWPEIVEKRKKVIPIALIILSILNLLFICYYESGIILIVLSIILFIFSKKKN